MNLVSLQFATDVPSEIVVIALAALIVSGLVGIVMVACSLAKRNKE